MRYRSRFTLALAALSLVACDNPTGLPDPVTRAFSRYVAIGTSVSMGWMSDGVLATSQEQSWPAQLAAAANADFALPLIASPGCKPPLKAPLATFQRIDGTSVGTASTVCAPNVTGVTLPTNNLAVENATATEVLNATPETATQGRGPVTSRVLPSGMTQLTAMRALKPSLVSVEVGGNEVLPAQVGVLAPNQTYVPFETFQAAYGKIIDSVKATGAKAVLVGLPTDIRQFPTIRTGAEIASQRAAFTAAHVTVTADCDASPNFIFVRGKVLTAVAAGAQRKAAGLPPYDLSCADVPGTADFVLTPADITFLNNLVAQMNAEIQSKATANQYAFFSLNSLYSISKDGVPFNLQAFLGTATPYGALISLDGVHPSAAGHTVLANAAIDALNTRYGYDIERIVTP